MNNYVYPNFIKIGNVARSDGGMTMREYYIGQALQGITSATMNYQREWTGQMNPDWIAEAAIKHADAVMKRLEDET